MIAEELRGETSAVEHATKKKDPGSGMAREMTGARTAGREHEDEAEEWTGPGASPLHATRGFRGASEALSTKTARFGACGTGRVTTPFLETEDADRDRPWGGTGGGGLSRGCVFHGWGPRQQEVSAVCGEGLE